MAKTNWTASDVVQPTHLNQIGEEINTATTAAAVGLGAANSVQDVFDAHVGSGGDAHALATTSTAGFMSAIDKTLVDSANTSVGSGDNLVKRDNNGNFNIGYATSGLHALNRDTGDARYHGRRYYQLNAGTYNDLDLENIDVVGLNTSAGDITITSILRNGANHRTIRFQRTNTAGTVTMKHNATGMVMASGRDIVLRPGTGAYGFIDLVRNSSNWFGNAISDYGDKYKPITISTANPSGGQDGDVWIKYIP